MTQTTLNTDVVIIGAGIAGLWLHHRLNDMGIHAILLEHGHIGQGQTLSSQGIIHGGSKYALNGVLSKAAQVISTMPARWKSALNGEGDIDLRNVKKLADHQLLWSKDKLSSKMVSFFASKALSSRMQRVEKREAPALFQDTGFKGTLYQLDEPVLDIPSLLTKITEKWHSRMLLVPKDRQYHWQRTGQKVETVQIGDMTIHAKQFVLTAGEGNEALLQSLGIRQPTMQRRPLQMVLCKSHDYTQPLPTIYAHSLGSGSKPIATISSHQTQQGETVWYIGGNIAEEGVGKSRENLIAEAQQLLNNILPWFKLPYLDWATHAVNRAEPKQSSLTRPDNAFIDSQQNIHICWPTKLALAPDLADQVLKAINVDSIEKQTYDNPDFPHPEIAKPLWDRAF
ncbi:FAD-dependent oxidoreductase [Methylophaga thalassica]|uniref:FAD-dependent oxidoreductase n=1 Tax=Methylophaga thalassica TaxID=40223 RepID=UPI002E7B1FF9|nr:FAD-dependent oxidoreductase [Methylophaga thalassica]WVI85811.1 FAD-dependent oxidoreductase [Methylophaga thalassica]